VGARGLDDLVDSFGANKQERPWVVPWKFLIHCSVGTAAFVIIAAFAVGLNFAIKHYLEARQFSPEIITGVKVGEDALFFTDLFLFLVFLLKTTIRYTKVL
jgi:hypothetical protein